MPPAAQLTTARGACERPLKFAPFPLPRHRVPPATSPLRARASAGHALTVEHNVCDAVQGALGDLPNAVNLAGCLDDAAVQHIPHVRALTGQHRWDIRPSRLHWAGQSEAGGGASSRAGPVLAGCFRLGDGARGRLCRRGAKALPEGRALARDVL